jgi:hypothetical protein
VRPLGAKESDDRAQSAQGQVPPQTGRYDKVSPSPLLSIGHLLFRDRSQANLGHSRPLKYSLPLHKAGSRNDDHIIAPTMSTAFEEKRHIEHRYRLSTRAGQSKKSLFRSGDHWMNDSLEPPERHRIRKDALPKKQSIDPA